MASSKTSSLTAASALTGPELFYADDGTNDVKVTADQIKTFTNGGAWTAYTPTLGATAGALTTATATGAYIQIGKTVSFRVFLTLTDKGTATGALTFTLPVAAKSGAAVYAYGDENAATGYGFKAQNTGGAAVLSTTVMSVTKMSDNTSSLTNGWKFFLQGTYEAV